MSHIPALALSLLAAAVAGATLHFGPHGFVPTAALFSFAVSAFREPLR